MNERKDNRKERRKGGKNERKNNQSNKSNNNTMDGIIILIIVIIIIIKNRRCLFVIKYKNVKKTRNKNFFLFYSKHISKHICMLLLLCCVF